jgi:hypothetical protein
MSDKKPPILEEIEIEAELHENLDPERSARYTRWAFYIQNLLNRINNNSMEK